MIINLVGQDWRVIDEFPDYEISDAGTVRNIKTRLVKKVVINKNNTTYVGLSRNGKQYNKSVSLMVAEIFLPAPERSTFNTPVHLNGDRTDCSARNLMWRPRWFTIQYHRECLETHNGERAVVMVTPPGITMTAKQASMKYGLLVREIILAATTQDETRKLVWPTLQRFDVVFRN